VSRSGSILVPSNSLSEKVVTRHEPENQREATVKASLSCGSTAKCSRVLISGLSALPGLWGNYLLTNEDWREESSKRGD
jgi:hypothetical protein